MKTIFALAILAAVALCACSKQDGADSQSQTTQQQAGDTQTMPIATGGTLLDPAKPTNVPLDGQPVTVAGVTFTAPATWTSKPASGMRSADYTFGPVEGDKDSATMVVFYFGPQGGGGIDANIERWIGQMTIPDGSDPHSKARKLEFTTAEGFKGHLVEVLGTYNPGAMGGMGSSGPREGYRMEGVVLEAPEGNLFFKLTGPEKTVEQMVPGLQAMIMSVKKAQAEG